MVVTCPRAGTLDAVDNPSARRGFPTPIDNLPRLIWNPIPSGAMRDLKEAFQSLIATPVPTLVIVITLALAIGANTSIFSVVNGVLLRPLGFDDEDSLVVLWETNAQQAVDKSETSTGNYRDWRRQSSSLDGLLAIYRYRGFTMTGLERPARVNSIQISPRAFDVLGVPPMAGRTLDDDDEVPGNERLIMLTHASWTRCFGADPSVVGNSVELDGEAYSIVGIMPEGFVFPPGDASVEMYSPLTIAETSAMDRPHRMYNTVGRLAAGTSLAAAQDELDAIGAQIAADFPQSNEGWGISVVPMRAEVVGEIGSTLWVLLGAVFAVLLIACANIANLLIARSRESSLDFTIRAALGAARWKLVRRSLADSVVLAAVGGAGGLLLALWGISFLRTVIPASVPRSDEIGVDGTVLAFAIAITAFTSLAFGLIPALRVMTPNLSDALKAGGKRSLPARSRWASATLVVAEVALALALLIGAGLMVRSFTSLSETDPGFRKEGVVAISLQLPSSRYSGSDDNRAFYMRLAELVSRIPDVSSTGAVSDLPMSEVGFGFEMPFSVVGLDAESPRSGRVLPFVA